MRFRNESLRVIAVMMLRVRGNSTVLVQLGFVGSKCGLAAITSLYVIDFVNGLWRDAHFLVSQSSA